MTLDHLSGHFVGTKLTFLLCLSDLRPLGWIKTKPFIPDVLRVLNITIDYISVHLLRWLMQYANTPPVDILCSHSL